MTSESLERLVKARQLKAEPPIRREFEEWRVLALCHELKVTDAVLAKVIALPAPKDSGSGP